MNQTPWEKKEQNIKQRKFRKMTNGEQNIKQYLRKLCKMTNGTSSIT